MSDAEDEGSSIREAMQRYFTSTGQDNNGSRTKDLEEDEIYEVEREQEGVEEKKSPLQRGKAVDKS